MRKKLFIIISSIFLIISISIIGSTVAKRKSNIKTNAEAFSTPLEIKIQQITSFSFTISWITESDFSGYIKYGTKPKELNAIGIDTKGTSKFKNHKILVQNLEPDTVYFFTIISENETYFSNGNPFEIKTLPAK